MCSVNIVFSLLRSQSASNNKPVSRRSEVDSKMFSHQDKLDVEIRNEPAQEIIKLTDEIMSVNVEHTPDRLDRCRV